MKLFHVACAVLMLSMSNNHFIKNNDSVIFLINVWLFTAEQTHTGMPFYFLISCCSAYSIGSGRIILCRIFKQQGDFKSGVSNLKI